MLECCGGIWGGGFYYPLQNTTEGGIFSSVLKAEEVNMDDRSPYVFSVVIDGEKIVESRPLNNDEARRLAEVLHLPFPAWLATNSQNRVGIHLDSTR